MPRIIFTNEEIDKMFEKVGINRTSLRNILLAIGPPVHLKDPHIVEAWKRKVNSNGASTTGYCHRVTEAVYRMGFMPAGFKVHQWKDEEGSHWFFKHENGEVIDLTADQFDDGYDYSKSRPKGLPNVSCLARTIAERLGHPL